MAYASKYYDPQKAHEYYMRTRELKGETSTKGMSEAQKETWAVTKDQIGRQKKADLTSAQEQQKARVEALRQKADAKKEALDAKLNRIFSDLEKRIGKVEKKPLHKIPENASPAVREFLEKQNRNIAKKNNEAMSRAKNYASKTLSDARKANSEERKKIGEGLKSAVSKAREDYKVLRESLKTEYDAAKSAEFEKIRSQA